MSKELLIIIIQELIALRGDSVTTNIWPWGQAVTNEAQPHFQTSSPKGNDHSPERQQV